MAKTSPFWFEPGFNAAIIHQGKSHVNCRRLTSRQVNVNMDKGRAHVKQKSRKRQAHVPLLSYTKSCDIHQYWFPCAFNSDSSAPDHPARAQWFVKITQDPPVCTNTHQRGPSASLYVGRGFDFTRSAMKGLRLTRIVVLQMTLVEPAAKYRGCRCLAQQEGLTWLEPAAQCRNHSLRVRVRLCVHWAER
ncbi:hypothetical protein O181_132400, partial [Austropuccinia psidii MF-1]|nr:hypothetical protein [Austropuccinia psidii MF-1]